MVLTIIIVIISLIALVVLHEFGHFILAKLFGIKVEEFGIGYPPRLVGKKIGETIYSLNLIPLGAFVKIYGEEGGIEEAHSFTGKPIWQRALIVLGGVVSFWIIAAILLTIIFSIGVPTAISDEENENLINPQVQILAVAPGSPAEKARIKIGDTIKQFSAGDFQIPINKVGEVQELTEKYKGQEIILTIERGKETFNVSLVPRVSPPEGEGAMGIALSRVAIKSYPWWIAPIKGIETCFSITQATLTGLVQIFGDLIQGEKLPEGVIVGPVGIGSLMTQFAKLGVIYYLQLIAIISIGLAISNLLPIPALDGGKLVFLLIEAIRKKPINPKTEQKISSVSFILLITLMIWLTIQDISRLF